MLKAKIMVRSSPSDDCVQEILNLFYLELQVINTKPVIKSNLKDLLGELKKFKDQTIFVLEYEKIGYH